MPSFSPTSRVARALARVLALSICVGLAACGGGGGGADDAEPGTSPTAPPAATSTPPPASTRTPVPSATPPGSTPRPTATPQLTATPAPSATATASPAPGRAFRALGGISMGAFGALNIASKHPERFGVVAALGGPVDLLQLLDDVETSGLEVKAQTGIPEAIGDDFTFDHLPPYPDRDTRLSLFKDLTISFGNPLLHHPDATRRYLAGDSEPAQVGQDDRFGDLRIPTEPRGFRDGGDTSDDGVRQVDEIPTLWTDVLLLATGTLRDLAPGAAGTDVGGRVLADLDGDGVFDVGDGLVLNRREPLGADGQFEPVRDDLGLDGVAGSGDFGEGNGRFDEDPDVTTWRAQDPRGRLEQDPWNSVASQRLYLDVGTEDEFGFARHYENLVTTLRARGIDVDVQDGFSGSCLAVPKPSASHLLVRYDGGHVGIPDVGGIGATAGLIDGDICGPVPIWQRLLGFLGFLDASFPGGRYGIGGIGLNPGQIDLGSLLQRGELRTVDVPAPRLALVPGAPPPDGAPSQRVVVYLPPRFVHQDEAVPLAYFLGGYGQKPEDFARIRDLMDLLIAGRQVQNLALAFLPGRGGVKGSFYANHVVPEAQVPDAAAITSGRYEDAILHDLMPYVEDVILEGRVKQDAAP